MIKRLSFLFDGWREARAWLEQQPTHDSYHITADPSPNYAGYTPQQVLRTPGLLDLFNHEVIIGQAASFIRFFPPVLYSVNAWWSLPAREPANKWSQFWHEDTDDDQPFLTLFVYLTDVDQESGPHQIDKGYWIATCEGPSGTLWLVDTRQTHRGLIPRKRPRLVCWARYGWGPNRNSLDKYGVKPQPLSELPTKMTGRPTERAINSLLVDFDA